MILLFDKKKRGGNEDTFFVPRDNSKLIKQREADIPMVKRKWGLLKAEDKQVKFALHYKLYICKAKQQKPHQKLGWSQVFRKGNHYSCNCLGLNFL